MVHICFRGGVQPLKVEAETTSETLTEGVLSYIKVDEDDNGTFDYIKIIDCDLYASKVNIPDKIDGLAVEIIEYEAFAYCEGLKSITLPKSVTSIGEFAFLNCFSLTNIEIPDSVTSIGRDAFINCESLTNIEIPDSVTIIENYTFAGCESLTSIEIPESVTSIGEYVFQFCNNLKSIIIENPECEIYDSSSTINNGITDDSDYYFNGTIYGYEDSTAQAYAEKYGYNFESLDELLVEIKPTENSEGDANGDGKINVRDCAFIAKALAKNEGNTLPSTADYNDDGKINVRDAAAIASALAKGEL